MADEKTTTAESKTEKKKLSRIEEYMAKMTPEEYHKFQSEAGKKSAAKRRAYRSQRELIKQLLATEVNDKELAAALQSVGLEATYGAAAVLAAARRATAGDIESTRYLRDTVGEKPTEQYNLGVSDKPIKSLDLSKLSDEELESLADSE